MLRCGVCHRTDYMDLPGFLGETDKVLGVQICAWCSDGVENNMKAHIGIRNGGRGRNGRLSERSLPKLTEDEFRLWVVLWLAKKLNYYALSVLKRGRVPVGWT